MACKLAIMISGLNLQRDRETDQREMQGHGIWLNSKENITCTTSKLTDVGSKLWSYANACRTQDDDDDDDDHELPQAEISLHEVLFRGNHKHPRTNIEAAGNTVSIVLSGPVRRFLKYAFKDDFWSIRISEILLEALDVIIVFSIY